MLDKKETKISEAEAQLYDRQIRLWGLDAQKRLRSSNILVIGLGGLGCEVAKNLVLSGIKAITLLDHVTVTENDACAQFLAPREEIGKNRAEASRIRVQRLNPMVEVSVDTEDPSKKTADYFRNFNIVCATNLSKETLVHINDLCRKNDVKFFAGDVFGFFGYSFTDLIQHQFVEEVMENTDNQDITSKDEKMEVKTKMQKREITFVPLKEALRVDWTKEPYLKKIKRMDSSYFILQVLYDFHSKMGSNPLPEKRDEHMKSLMTIRETVTQRYNLPQDKIQEQIVSMLFGELSPVAAIVGGVLSQEIIKTISNKDPPHKNFFFYNPLNSSGVVEQIGF